MFAHDGFYICVGIYAFMIGYGYAFSRSKDLKYGWRHIKKLMIPYLTIFLVFILPVCYKEFFSSGWKMMLFTVFGLDVRFFYYNWFIYVFIYAMLIMPLFARFIDIKPIRNTVITIIFLYLSQVISHYLIYPHLESHFFYLMYNCLSLSPLILLGYLFAIERYFEHIRVDNLPKSLVIIGFLLGVVAVIFLDSKIRLGGGFLFEFFYVPVLVVAIAFLFSKFELRYLRPMMIKLGWASMYMWFLQAIIHTPVVRGAYQPIITIFNDINLVVLWTIIVLFIVAWLLRSINDYIVGSCCK